MNRIKQNRESAFLMSGNGAIARGAWEAGVRVACAYFNPLNTGVLESLAGYPEVDCEWSSSEKVAFEVSSGASLAGARALVSMMHGGLNLAAGPFFSVAYMGVNAGLVIVVADDPGMHSSQNEQDSRPIGRAARVAMLEPSSQQEAKDYTVSAFEISEQFDTPVMIRTTTSLIHTRSKVWQGRRYTKPNRLYYKNPIKHVALPVHGRIHHRQIEIERIPALEHESEKYVETIEGSDELAFITSGITFLYVREAFPQASVLKLGMTHPLPRNLIRNFVYRKKRVIVVEELQPYLEEQVRALGIACEGKDRLPTYGEISPNVILEAFDKPDGSSTPGVFPSIPPRPPTLCAGCMHCGVLYELHQLGSIVTGDIGCYTCGARLPLSAMDSCMNMGASIGMAHGMGKVLIGSEKSRIVAVIGDSAFCHSGVNGLINLAQNRGCSTVVILENHKTAMTGYRQDPSANSSIPQSPFAVIDLESLCRGIGIEHVCRVDPYDLLAIWRVLDQELHRDALSVVIVSGSCVLDEKKSFGEIIKVNHDLCTACLACAQLGCPAIEVYNGYPSINPIFCIACSNCQQVCATCNAGIDIPTVLELMQQDRYDEALKTVLRTNPFPAISSRICQQPCNNEFNALGLNLASTYTERYPDLAKRFSSSGPFPKLAVQKVMKFLGDYSLNAYTGMEFRPAIEREEKVAIIGAGPAGLSAAWYLRRCGFQVDIFELQSKPGGMLRYEIPRIQLPLEILNKEIDRISKIGVRIQCKSKAGRDIAFSELLASFDAVIVAVGKSMPRELALEGMNCADRCLLSAFELSADSIISAIGKIPDLEFMGSLADLSFRFTGESANPKVFACGDIAFSKGSIIQAIASGRRVAETVADRLMGKRSI
jgi:indolepyruvate ferredoxin oxidoreductase alpha subunit